MFTNLIHKLRGWFDVETGDMVPVENQGRYRSANPYYFAARLRTGWSDERECFLFTEHELDSARVRAQKNREDLPWCSEDDGSCKCGTKS